MDSPKRDQSYVKHDAEEKNTRGLKKKYIIKERLRWKMKTMLREREIFIKNLNTFLEYKIEI